MSADTFSKIVQRLFGGRGSQSAFARYTGIPRQAVNYFINGRSPIPRHVALLAWMLYLHVEWHVDLPDAWESDRFKARKRPKAKAL
jgi:hypothetical protein